jgi:hypothetical protein
MLGNRSHPTPRMRVCRGLWLAWLPLGSAPILGQPFETPSTRPAQSASAPSLSPEMSDVVAQAQKRVEKEHPQPEGALVYAIAGSDGRRPQATARLHTSPGGFREIPADTEHPNVIYQRSAQNYVLRISAPGYQTFARPITFQPGSVLVWDDVVLERVTAETGATIDGGVRMEDDADPSGVVISAEGQRTKTDDLGHFSIAGLGEGEVKVAASKPGYAVQSALVSLTRGATHGCELRLFRQRFALVRWSCQIEPGKSLGGWVRYGVAVVSPGGLDRVSILKGFTDVDTRSDFFVSQYNDKLKIQNTDSRSGPEPPGILRVEAQSFEELTQPPAGDYRDSHNRRLTLEPGAVFVLRCFDGERYAKMAVLAVGDSGEQFAQRTVAARLGCDLAATAAGPGRDVPSVAVLDFDAEDALRAEADALSDLCRKQIQETERFILVDRNTIRLVLREEDFAASMRCDDTRCLVNYGAKLRAQKLVHGRLARVAEGLMLTLKMVDVGTARIDGVETARTGADVKELFDVIEPTSCALLSQALRSKTAGAADHVPSEPRK